MLKAEVMQIATPHQTTTNLKSFPSQPFIDEIPTFPSNCLFNKGREIQIGEGWWWCLPSTPALGRQRQANLQKFKSSLVYSERFRTASARQRNPALNIQKQTNKQK